MVVKLLKMHGEEMTVMVHARNDYGLTALDLATRYGHIGIVRLLAPIHSDAPLTDFDTREYLGSALMQARNLEISKFLVSEGADVNFNPAHSGTPLHCAAFAQNLDLVQFMLAAGADPNIHNSRFIPLFNTRDVDITNALLAAGANLHAEDASGRNVLSHVIFNMEMLRLFLERGVDPDHEDNSGRTALHYACGAGVRFKLESPEACVELLVQSGAATVEKKDTLGHTPVVKMLEPLVQDPDLKLRIMAWWVENKMK
ncbi:ankyrin repeat-containing domain protein [Mycena galopus ATCC 62051]|nr:ankyrin repeat-containing domain protein [Mycena galopus ATCC 62051]